MAGLGPVDGSVVVFETGGGSTQFTFGHGERVEGHWSVDVGALRLTEQFGLDGAVGADVVAEALRSIGDELTPLDGRPRPDVLVGLGGAVTNLAAVRHGLAEYDREIVHGTELTLEELDEQIERFRTRSAEERRTIPGLQPKRAEVILAGACVVRAVLTELRRDSFTVSDRGLRHRLVVERFGAAA
jgi:exopolyphosphatase/guanosine-5'-triphosphate,3'-diphosphate pyrophosphatase